MKISIYCDDALVAQSPEVVGYVPDGTKCTAVWFGGTVEGVATNDAGGEYAWARHWDVSMQVPAGYRLIREVYRFTDRSIPPNTYPPDDHDSAENVLGPRRHHSGTNESINEIYDWWKIWDPDDEDVLSYDCEVIYYFESVYVTVTFDARGGVGAPAPMRVQYLIGANLPSTVPTREGYRFLGWVDELGGTPPVYQPGDMYTPTRVRDYVLYAVWEAIVAPGLILRDPVSGKILRGGPNSQILRTPGLAQSGSSDQ